MKKTKAAPSLSAYPSPHKFQKGSTLLKVEPSYNERCGYGKINAMIILFDIDRTLLNTDKLKDKIQNERLPELFGVAAQQLEPITNKYLSSLNSTVEFSPRAYAKLLADKFDKDKQKAALDIFLNNPVDFQAALFPEVIPTLKKLHQKYYLGIFSEGNLESQKAKLKQSGIEKFLDPNLTFIFPTKADKLNFVWNKVKNYHCSVFIVDDSEKHIAEIAKIRFIPILIQRDKKRQRGYFSIQKLSELPFVIQNI